MGVEEVLLGQGCRGYKGWLSKNARSVKDPIDWFSILFITIVSDVLRTK